MCRFRLHKFRSLVDLFTISSMCWLKESLLSRITPRYFSDLTSSRTMEFDESELSMFRLLYTAVEVCCGGAMFEGDVCMRYLNLILVFVLFVILRSLHFFMLNFICHLSAQSWSRRMSCCSECESAKVSIFRYNALSSANSLILEVRLFSMSLMYRRNRSGPSTVPWGTPDVTICVSEWEPFTSTW